MKNSKNLVTILSITSGIGTALAERYSAKGDVVIGTYRSTDRLGDLEKIKNCHLFYCDLSDKNSIKKFAEEFGESNFKWNTLISCPCDPRPLKSFFEGNFEEWSDSIHINAIEQLRVLHEIYKFRDKENVANVVYFSGGGGPNKAVINISAYNLSKVMLMRMCELLDAENKDLNPFVIGPGWVKTKNHEFILKHLDPSDKRYDETKDFLKNKKGTSMDDIFNCIEWLCNQGKEITGGRNFSVVYDNWGDEKLSQILKSNSNAYKLRREGNDLFVKK